MPREDLDRENMDKILSKAQDGTLGTGGALGTMDKEGNPYVVPMGFKYTQGTIYLFCDYVGEKVRNIRGNPYVCLAVTHREPGRTSSVIVRGKAKEFKDETLVRRVWGEKSLKLMRKHSPRGVYFKIKPEKISGKAYFRSTV